MQINRLFEIVYILLESRTVTAAELAERFEVSARTIYRDVETLSQAGIPIYMSKGKNGGISLLPDFIFNKAVLTEKEKIDVLSAVKAVSAVSLSRDDTAMNKLCSMLGKQNADWIEVDFSSWNYLENHADYFEKIKTAVLEKRIVTFMYASGKSEKLMREVMPLKLVFKGAAWYLYGFCTMREDYRFFKLRRIDNLYLTENKFEMTAPENILSCEKNHTSQLIKTELLISAKMAFRVYDEINSYKIGDRGDFFCEIYLPDINTICGYAASFGEYCKIISPKEAVIEMKSRLENSLKKYL